MRYRKGSVIINEAQDVPLLLLVRNSGYIKHEQLLFLAGYDKSKASLTSFCWRVRRLISGGFISLAEDRVEGDKVYAITRKGLEKLEKFGHTLLSLHSEAQTINQPAKMMHSLGLNEIRLTFQRNHMLNSWLSDLEVCSENLLDRRQIREGLRRVGSAEHRRPAIALCHRLISGGFISPAGVRVEGDKVYAITRKGLEKLETFGHTLLSLHSEAQTINQPAKTMHSLGLNEIRLTFTAQPHAEFLAVRSGGLLGEPADRRQICKGLRRAGGAECRRPTNALCHRIRTVDEEPCTL